MITVAISGKDTFNCWGRVFTNLANANAGELRFPEECLTRTVGKGGNIIYGFNFNGLAADMTLRLLRGSDDDVFMLTQFKLLKMDPAAYAFGQGQFVKRMGNGLGTVRNDTYQLLGVGISRLPGAATDTTGGADQSIAIWEMKVGNADRGIL